MKLSVIIVNYNVRAYLEQCLCTVSEGMKGIDGDVFVVDNLSTDGSVEMVRDFLALARRRVMSGAACRVNASTIGRGGTSTPRERSAVEFRPGMASPVPFIRISARENSEVIQ